MFIGTNDGFVHIVSSSFRVLRSFKAHDAGSITHMKQINGTSLLVTVAEELTNEPALKVWALDTEKKDGGPRCLSSVSVQNARRQFPVRGTIQVISRGTKASGKANGLIDLCICRSRRSFASCRWVRQWIGDDYSRRPDSR